MRVPYIRVLGLQTEESNSIGGGNVHRFTDDEVESFRTFAAKPDVYDQLVKSIAPSIWGAVDIKKAVACLLFGGSRKRYVWLIWRILSTLAVCQTDSLVVATSTYFSSVTLARLRVNCSSSWSVAHRLASTRRARAVVPPVSPLL